LAQKTEPLGRCAFKSYQDYDEETDNWKNSIKKREKKNPRKEELNWIFSVHNEDMEAIGNADKRKKQGGLLERVYIVSCG